MRRRATGRGVSNSPRPPEYRAVTGTGVQGLVGGESLPGEEPDFRRRFSARGRRRAPPPNFVIDCSAEGGLFVDFDRFCAPPGRRATRAQTPTGQTAVQQDQEEEWAARCRYNPCRQISGSGWDLKYVRCKGKSESIRRFCDV